MLGQRIASFIATKEKRPRDEMLREIWNLGEGGPLCTEQTASTVYYEVWSVAVQNLLCWLACSVHNGPPSPKFKILPSQLRQTADRAAVLFTYKESWIATAPPPPQRFAPAQCLKGGSFLYLSICVCSYSSFLLYSALMVVFLRETFTAWVCKY